MSPLQSILKIIQDAARIQIKRSKSIVSQTHQSGRAGLSPTPTGGGPPSSINRHISCNHNNNPTTQTHRKPDKEPLQEYQQSDDLEFLSQMGNSRFPSLPKTSWISPLGSTDKSGTSTQVSGVRIARSTPEQLLDQTASVDLSSGCQQSAWPGGTFRLFQPSTWLAKIPNTIDKNISKSLPTNAPYVYSAEPASKSAKYVKGAKQNKRNPLKAYVLPFPFKPFLSANVGLSLPDVFTNLAKDIARGPATFKEALLYKKLQARVQHWTNNVKVVKSTSETELTQRSLLETYKSEIQATHQPCPRLQPDTSKFIEGLFQESKHFSMPSRQYSTKLAPGLSADYARDLPGSNRQKKAYVLPSKGNCGCEPRQLKPAVEKRVKCYNVANITAKSSYSPSFKTPGCDRRKRLNCDPILMPRSVCLKIRVPALSFADMLKEPRCRSPIDSTLFEDLKLLQPGVQIATKNELQSLKKRADCRKALAAYRGIRKEDKLETNQNVDSMNAEVNVKHLCNPQPSFRSGYTHDAAFPSGLLVANTHSKTGPSLGLLSKSRYQMTATAAGHNSLLATVSSKRTTGSRLFSTFFRPDIKDLHEKVGEVTQLQREANPIMQRVFSVRRFLKRRAFNSKLSPKLGEEDSLSTGYFPSKRVFAPNSLDGRLPQYFEDTGENMSSHEKSEYWPNYEVGGKGNSENSNELGNNEHLMNFKISAIFNNGYLNIPQCFENTVNDLTVTDHNPSNDYSLTPETAIVQTEQLSPKLKLNNYITRELHPNVLNSSQSINFDGMNESLKSIIQKQISNLHKTVKIPKYVSFPRTEKRKKNITETTPKFIQIEGLSHKLKFPHDISPINISSPKYLGSPKEASKQISERISPPINNAYRKILANLHKPTKLLLYPPTIINRNKQYYSDINPMTYQIDTQNFGVNTAIRIPFLGKDATLSPPFTTNYDMSDKINSGKVSPPTSHDDPSNTHGMNQPSLQIISQLQQSIYERNKFIATHLNRQFVGTGKSKQQNKMLNSFKETVLSETTGYVKSSLNKQISNVNKITNLISSSTEARVDANPTLPYVHERSIEKYKMISKYPQVNSAKWERNETISPHVDAHRNNQNSKKLGSSDHTFLGLPLNDSPGKTLTNLHKTKQLKFASKFISEISRNYHNESISQLHENSELTNNTTSRYISMANVKTDRFDGCSTELNYVDDYFNELSSNDLNTSKSIQLNFLNESAIKLKHIKNNPQVNKIIKVSDYIPYLREEPHREIAAFIKNNLLKNYKTTNEAGNARKIYSTAINYKKHKHELCSVNNTKNNYLSQQRDRQRGFANEPSSKLDKIIICNPDGKNKPQLQQHLEKKATNACCRKISVTRPFKECPKPPQKNVRPAGSCEDNFKPKITKCDYKTQTLRKGDSPVAKSGTNKITSGQNYEKQLNMTCVCSEGNSFQLPQVPPPKINKQACELQSDSRKLLPPSANGSFKNGSATPENSKHETSVNTVQNTPPIYSCSAFFKSVEKVSSCCENKEKEMPINEQHIPANTHSLEKPSICCEYNEKENDLRYFPAKPCQEDAKMLDSKNVKDVDMCQNTAAGSETRQGKSVIIEANRHRFPQCHKEGDTFKHDQESTRQCANKLTDLGESSNTTDSCIRAADLSEARTEQLDENGNTGIKGAEQDVCENYSRYEDHCTKEMIMAANSHRFSKCKLQVEGNTLLTNKKLDNEPQPACTKNNDSSAKLNAATRIGAPCIDCIDNKDNKVQHAWKTCKKMPFSCPVDHVVKNR